MGMIIGRKRTLNIIPWRAPPIHLSFHEDGWVCRVVGSYSKRVYRVWKSRVHPSLNTPLFRFLPSSKGLQLLKRLKNWWEPIPNNVHMDKIPTPLFPPPLPPTHPPIHLLFHPRPPTSKTALASFLPCFLFYFARSILGYILGRACLKGFCQPTFHNS